MKKYHPSHDLETRDSSHYDYVCKKCDTADTPGGPGKLAYPCSAEYSDATRVDKIKTASGKILEDILESIENITLDEDQFLAETYARLIATRFLGYSPTALVEDAEAAAQRILALAEESEVTDEIQTVP